MHYPRLSTRHLLLLCVIGCVFAVTATPALGSRARGGSDYRAGGPPGIAPANCTGSNISTFGDLTAVCGFSGSFGSGDQFAHDTILHFELTNSSPSVSVTSATLQFSPTALPDDFGFVECGTPGDPNSMLSDNPAVPCTAESALQAVTFSIPTDASGNPKRNPDGTLLVSFSNFSGLYAGTGLTDGVTIYFEDPNQTSSFASVTAAATSTSTSNVPEPASLALMILGTAGLLGVGASRKRRQSADC